ncbi:spore coat polysaccharide biosynthesis protein SpsF [Fodinibius roseus]|uniref:Spore coat polysaccharide biosynthesis protein SpsF n=2 Tax=Fodinibius roseus TaxID=1194090 RepID=A0A1M5J2P0_9BACT|nr:spore coat polysaccharide biosynthesis protein SpsF [Fodinibius roseus]
MDLNGKPIVVRVIERAQKVYNIDDIILCTSTNKQDKPLTDIALKSNIHYYLGSEEDVLKRLTDASNFYGLDYVLSITGENPLFSVTHANRVVDTIIEEEPDFTYLEGLPIGCGVSGIKVKALEVICKIKKVIDTEIWGPLINQPSIFDVHKIVVNEFYRKPDLRITTDYIEDYQFINTLFSHFEPDDIPSLASIMELLDTHSEYLEIHKEREQEELSENKLSEIKSFYINNKDQVEEIKNSIY